MKYQKFALVTGAALAILTLGIAAPAQAATLASGDQLFGVQKGIGGNGNSQQVFSYTAPSGGFALGSPLGSATTNSNDVYAATYDATTQRAYYFRAGAGLVEIDPVTGDQSLLGSTSPATIYGLECIPSGECFTMMNVPSIGIGLGSFDLTTRTATNVGSGTGIDQIFGAGLMALAYDASTSQMYVWNLQGGSAWYTVDLGTGVFTPLTGPSTLPTGQPLDGAFDSQGVLWFGASADLYSWTPGDVAPDGPYVYKLSSNGTTAINNWLQFIVPGANPDPTPVTPTLPDTGSWSWTSGVAVAVASVLCALGVAALVLMRRRLHVQNI